MSTDKDGTQAGEWHIAGHNGLVVDGKTGETSIDEYAKKNLRTVAIDVDVEGKYVEFAVAKASAKELRDRLNALTRKAAQADALAEQLVKCASGLATATTFLMGLRARLEAQKVEGQTLAWSLSGGDWETYGAVCDVLATLASYTSNPASENAT